MRVRTEAKRDTILEVAARVFYETGFERASMAEIAAQLGGSKATLYGYFPSKEQLFLAVAQLAGRRQVDPAFDELESSRGHDEIGTALRRFGEKLMAFLASPTAIAARRMVQSEANRSDIGRRFHEIGPARGHLLISGYLGAAMDEAVLRRADPQVAAQHLIALLEAELLPSRMMGLETAAPTRRRLRQVVDRAVAVFLAAYAPLPVPAEPVSRGAGR